MKVLLLKYHLQLPLLSGINKEVVGQTAAYIRSLRSPELIKVKVSHVCEYNSRKEAQTGKYRILSCKYFVDYFYSKSSHELAL